MSMNNSRFLRFTRNPKLPGCHERGVVLIVSLIMLLLMTIIGVSGMQSTTLEEKMAGNMRNKNLAFQAAESALEAGEIFLGTKKSAELSALVFSCAGTDGLFTQSGVCSGTATKPIWDDDTVWANDKTNVKSVSYPGKFADIQASPRYIIEDLGLTDCHGSGAGTNDCRHFRVTARAVGGTADAVVIVQSIFLRPK